MKVIALILTVVLSINAEATPLLVTKDNTRPNILLVMLDDVGFMGLGVYGSDAVTPNIDKIAQQGMQFSRYYTAPMCGPSRAMLMTGQDSHQVGMATLVESLTPEMEQHPSYSMEWQDNQKTLASRLKKSGYQTFVSGKWGIGRNGKNLPHRFGFDRSFVLDATGASNYQEKPYMALYKTVKWFEDGKRVSLPEDFYSSRDLVDKMITYVDEADTNKPFFAYLSLQAIHIPVQVPLEYIDKYNGVFDQGWDEMRKQRLQKAINLGLVPSSTTLANVPESHRNWDELSTADKTYWARMMQVNAGMTEAADYHIGRLLKHLEKQGKLDNTLVVITSDNGSEYNTIGQGANSVIENIGTKLWMQSLNWDTDLDNLGQRDSLAAIGPEWASVTSAPFNLYKFNSSEGGQRVPLVMSGPGIRNLGLVSGRAHITDIVPTLLEQAAVPFNPDEFYGRSLTPMLNAQVDDVWGDDSFAFETSGNASVYRGNWKIALIKQPLGDEIWHLYDVVNDPGETTDLATKFPVLFQEMLNEYQAYSKMVGIIELAKGENAINQIRANAIKERVTDNWPKVLILLVVIGLIVFGIKKAKQKH
ncbi:arylsulfatase [Paraglaciecola arctica]|uniref:Arylsulfatase n=1 Tax=Paraglaciecola arctica BSs20135 TaxID=493475 RepID=K6XFH4_9ALTE|nr:arylsulfatase [Paraglaciecola arctica]GAC19384.1 arylsulfatase [Paraglaciecola arctica BSs20135]